MGAGEKGDRAKGLWYWAGDEQGEDQGSSDGMSCVEYR